MKIFEQPQPTAGGGRRGDVFAWLTYRQRYEEARTLMARDASPASTTAATSTRWRRGSSPTPIAPVTR
jgi:hypothetical protein